MGKPNAVSAAGDLQDRDLLAALVEAAVRRAMDAAFARHRTALQADIRSALAAGLQARGPRDGYDAGLIMALAEHVSGREDWLCGDVIAQAETSDLLKQALADADVETVADLGQFCRRMIDVPVNGIVMKRAGRSSGGMRWSVVSVV